jgi:hypothetical protein
MKILSPNICLDTDGLKKVPAGQAGRYAALDATRDSRCDGHYQPEALIWLTARFGNFLM